MTTQVCLQLVTWNGQKYIEPLFASLRNQKFKDWELFVLDNASTDETAQKIRTEIASIMQPVHFIESPTNTGFVGGHTRLFSETIQRAPYVLLVNQDMVLDPDYIEKLFYFMEIHDDAGATSGRLMRWDFPEKTNCIDTIGLRGYPNHRVIDMHGGEAWREVEDDVKAIEVFGVSGALPMYRTEALQSVAYENEIFDLDFFMYKEDVDLAWRMLNAGWHAFTVLDAVAYHDRSASGPQNLSDRAALKNRALKSATANTYSYRNHILMLIKNYHITHEWASILPILWYEFKKSCYLLLFETKIFFKSIYDIVRLLPRMLRKRRFIAAHIKVTPEEVAWWFRGK